MPRCLASLRACVTIRALVFIVPPFLAACTPHSQPLQVMGVLETPGEEATIATSAVIGGWVLDPSGVDRVEVRMDGANHAARYGIARRDIARTHPDYPDSARAGFEFKADIDALSSGRHAVSVVAVGRDGHETMLGRRSLIAPSAMRLWADRLAAAPGFADRRFFFLMATSAIPQGGAKDAEKQYGAYYSATMRTGITVPILYLRTTKGAADDWVFDPDFQPIHRCKDRLVAEDSLNGVIGYAVQKKLPVQFSLNGGVWADSSCDTPEWDVNDHLEQDVDNCQWTQDNIVYPDDYLKNLTGSIDSPELARVLTYNVYAGKVRYYKKRNLQAAARLIVRFAQEHPDLFVGVNLDADTYMNPFFEQKEWFDYNPGTIRQFRHWLKGTGPYAEKGEPGTPDLSAYRRKKPLTLSEINRIARRRWTSWSEVDPPRVFPGTPHDPLLSGQTPIWDDPWYQEWDVFRKHLVGLHYDELSQWVHDAGIPTDRIYSAQGFVAPGPMLKPFAVRLDSHGQNYDSAGVSIEGAIPRAGHLGAILYGKSAQNLARMEVPHSLFATFSRMDSGWAVAEFNSTDLQQPGVLPGYDQAYRSFRDLFNYDAKQVTVMAWNGSDGASAGQKGFLAYTAWRNTPAEEAMKDFLVSHANLPRGARLWTFGSPGYADDDGWSAHGARLIAGRGYVDLVADGGAAILLSPPDQVIRANEAQSLIVGFIEASAANHLRVLARKGETDEWREIAPRTRVSELRADAAGVTVALSWPEEWRSANTIVEQLNIELDFTPGAGNARLARIAVYPREGIGDKAAPR